MAKPIAARDEGGLNACADIFMAAFFTLGKKAGGKGYRTKPERIENCRARCRAV